MIVLHEGVGYPRQVGKLALVIALEKEPAAIAEYPRLEDQEIGDVGLDDVHDGSETR